MSNRRVSADRAERAAQTRRTQSQPASPAKKTETTKPPKHMRDEMSTSRGRALRNHVMGSSATTSTTPVAGTGGGWNPIFTALQKIEEGVREAIQAAKQPAIANDPTLSGPSEEMLEDLQEAQNSLAAYSQLLTSVYEQKRASFSDPDTQLVLKTVVKHGEDSV